MSFSSSIYFMLCLQSVLVVLAKLSKGSKVNNKVVLRALSRSIINIDQVIDAY